MILRRLSRVYTPHIWTANKHYYCFLLFTRMWCSLDRSKVIMLSLIPSINVYHWSGQSYCMLFSKLKSNGNSFIAIFYFAMSVCECWVGVGNNWYNCILFLDTAHCISLDVRHMLYKHKKCGLVQFLGLINMWTVL